MLVFKIKPVQQYEILTFKEEWVIIVLTTCITDNVENLMIYKERLVFFQWILMIDLF